MRAERRSLRRPERREVGCPVAARPAHTMPDPNDPHDTPTEANDLRSLRGMELLTVEVACARTDGTPLVTSSSRLVFMPVAGS
mgnify:CR=1 FL=1